MTRLICILLALLAVAGCGSSNDTSSMSAVTYHSALKQADITTRLKHVVFFNTTTSTFTKYDNLITIPKGTIRDQAFVDDDVLSVPLPYNEQDAIIADPVDPQLYLVVRLDNGYFMKHKETGAVTGPFASVITRSNVDTNIFMITFDMQSSQSMSIEGSFKSRQVPASWMYANIFEDGGAILIPPDGMYNGFHVNSGHWKVDSVKGALIPAI